MTANPVLVSTVEEALEAAQKAGEKGEKISLETPYGALGYMGPAYFLEMERGVRALYGSVVASFALHGGNDAGLILAALREGVKRLVVDVPPETFERLASLAQKYEAQIFNRREASSLSPMISILS